MYSYHPKIQELVQVLCQTDSDGHPLGRPHGAGLRFFYADRDSYITLSDKGCVISSWLETVGGVIDNSFVGRLDNPLDRGSILKIFAMLEALINELLHLKLLGLSIDKSKESELLDTFLVHSHFAQKAKMLEEYEVFELEVSQAIYDVAKVRDVYAHCLDVREARFPIEGEKGKKENTPLSPQVFKIFKNTLDAIFQSLLQAFQVEFNQHDIDGYIDRVIKIIQEYRKKELTAHNSQRNITSHHDRANLPMIKQFEITNHLVSPDDRGGVLEIVALLEAYVNALLRLKLLKMAQEKTEESRAFDKLLINSTFPQKGEMLKDCMIFEPKEWAKIHKNIHKIARVRNVYAHRLNVGEARFPVKKRGERRLSEPHVFDMFKNTLGETFQSLQVAFQKVSKQCGID